MLILGSTIELTEGIGPSPSIGLELVLQAPEADPEQPRRLRAVAPHAVQRLENVLLLQIPQRQPRRQPRSRGLARTLGRRLPQGQHVDVNGITLAQYHRLLDAVLQLPHVARPLRPQQELLR